MAPYLKFKKWHHILQTKCVGRGAAAAGKGGQHRHEEQVGRGPHQQDPPRHHGGLPQPVLPAGR